MSAGQNYYITTPIYYVNDKPHIGHAYTTLACDVMARFKRMDGFNVHFLTGTDEHGQKVEQSAEKAGIHPQEFTDKVSQNFRDLVETMNFSNNDFIRTTEERHKVSTQALWSKLQESGDIYLGAYAGWYAVRDEAFYTEAELEDGPNGTKIAPTGAEVEWVEEPSYFFKLSAWEDKLMELYESQPDFIMPKSRRNEVMSFVKGGLRDLSVSRTTFNWGVPVPGDDEHIMYVWLDALTNYITAVGYPEVDDEKFKAFWPADLHMVGKDIVRFHAVYWPAFLMAAGLPLPKRVFAHGWWTNEGQKISKSVGNVIDPNELVETFGLDQTRYFLMREVPFGNDGDFSREAMISRMNTDLANDIGNLCQRVLSMVFKNCDEQFPEYGDFTEEDLALQKMADDALIKVRELIDVQSFHRALETIWAVVGESNRYVDTQAPWALRKTDMDRMKTVLYVLSDTIRKLALLTRPFMPESSDKMLNLLCIDENSRDYSSFNNSINSGVKIDKPVGIFPRFVEAETDQ